MLKSQEIQLQMSELLERANKLAAIEPNEAQHEDIRQQIAALEPKYRLAIEGEAARTEGAEFSAESPEVRELVHRANAGAIIAAVAEHRSTEGPELELQRALGVAGDVVPWQLMEKRAACTLRTGQ